MHTTQGLEFRDEATVTWCACERCNAAGPRRITLIHDNQEYTVDLRSDCCASSKEDDLVCDEAVQFTPVFRPGRTSRP